MKVLLVTDQFKNTNSGPGRFANYFKGYLRDADVISLDNYSGKTLIKYIRLYWTLLRCKGDYDVCVFNTPLVGIIGGRKCYKIVMLNDPRQQLFLSHIGTYLLGLGFIKTIKVGIYAVFESIALNRADRIVVNSIYLKSLLPIKLESKDLLVMHKAIDIDTYKPLNRNKGVLSLGFIKNDWKRGGLVEVIGFVNNLAIKKAVRFVVAGFDIDDEVRLLFSQVHPDVDLVHIGKISARNTIDFYNDISILLSWPTQEAFGVSNIEAAACGCWVLSRAIDGIPEASLGIPSYLTFHKKEELVETLCGLGSIEAQIVNENRRVIHERFSVESRIKSLLSDVYN